MKVSCYRLAFAPVTTLSRRFPHMHNSQLLKLVVYISPIALDPIVLVSFRVDRKTLSKIVRDTLLSEV